MSIWRKLIERMLGPSAPCACGGRIYQFLDWNDFHYHCTRCGDCVDAETFVKARAGEAVGKG